MLAMIRERPAAAMTDRSMTMPYLRCLSARIWGAPAAGFKRVEYVKALLLCMRLSQGAPEAVAGADPRNGIAELRALCSTVSERVSAPDIGGTVKPPPALASTLARRDPRERRAVV